MKVHDPDIRRSGSRFYFSIINFGDQFIGGKLNIYHISGILVLTKQINSSEFRINKGELKAGNYLIKAIDKKNSIQTVLTVL